MGIASMVIGILAAILAFIPLCGYIAFVPAVIGLILGIVDVSKKKKQEKPKGQGIAGIVLNAVAIGLIWLYTAAIAGTAALAVDAVDDAVNEYNKAYDKALDDYNKAVDDAMNSLNY